MGKKTGNLASCELAAARLDWLSMERPCELRPEGQRREGLSLVKGHEYKHDAQASESQRLKKHTRFRVLKLRKSAAERRQQIAWGSRPCPYPHLYWYFEFASKRGGLDVGV